jgi:iron complex outermembrane recepter protein
MSYLPGADRRTCFKSVSISLSALAAGMFWAPAAFAQVGGAVVTDPDDLEAPAEAAAEEGDSIIVTGSRLARSTFDTPSPVTVLGSEELDRLQVTNIGEGVAELPAFRPSNPTIRRRTASAASTWARRS